MGWFEENTGLSRHSHGRGSAARAGTAAISAAATIAIGNDAAIVPLGNFIVDRSPPAPLKYVSNYPARSCRGVALFADRNDAVDNRAQIRILRREDCAHAQGHQACTI